MAGTILSEGCNRMGNNDLLGVVISSGVRREILLFLSDGAMPLADIKAHVNISSQQLSPCIRELLGHDLICVKERKYSLTPVGRAIVTKLKPFLKTIDLFEQHSEFWMKHTLGGLPEVMMDRIEEISPGTLVVDVPGDLDRTFEEFYKVLDNSQYLIGISPIYGLEITQAFVDQAFKNKSISIIMKSDIYNKLITKSPEFADIQKVYPNVNFYLCNMKDLPCFFVTDKYLFLSLYLHNGNVDLQSNFISSEGSAIQWGLDLFEYYRLCSEKLP